MQNPEAPGFGAEVTRPPPVFDGDGAAREKTRTIRAPNMEDNDSEPESNREAPKGAVAVRPFTTHPGQGRMIHVISGGSDVDSISHGTIKGGTQDNKQGSSTS